MSLFWRAQVDRRPMVWARIANTAAAAASISGGGPPSSIPTNAIAPLRMNSPISATLGRYVNRTSAYAVTEPRISAITELDSPTITVFTYGRSVSLPSSTRM